MVGLLEEESEHAKDLDIKDVAFCKEAVFSRRLYRKELLGLKKLKNFLV